MNTDAVTVDSLRCWARRLIDSFGKRQLVTWEHRDEGARLLMVTNVWPETDRPLCGPFVKRAVDAVRSEGIACDVLFIRGYRGTTAYIAGALTSLILPFAYPNKYLLVHSHGGETALAARCFTGAPVLASYFGTDLLGAQIGGHVGLRIKCWLRSAILRRHASLMSRTTTKSAEMERLLMRRARVRNAVIPDGVDRERFRPSDQATARRFLGWQSDGTYVLFAGRVEAVEKRLWLAELAVAMARRQVPAIELQVVSDVPSDDMALYYVAADCLLHTSVSEGSPNTVKEALACNLPVIATPAGDVHELLSRVKHCKICDADAGALAVALVTVLDTGGRSNGRDLTKHLSTESSARRTVQLYRAMGFPGSNGSRSTRLPRSSAQTIR
jgi:teichuronic acid biosynthesis glycosyltransferase TuaC